MHIIVLEIFRGALNKHTCPDDFTLTTSTQLFLKFNKTGEVSLPKF